ncbi:J domain-containing protein [Variovorax sp. ZS18.2.2]|uniref:J domain-containing protein n=1 Tax=Variovorax sp. ZS18.2.2 TaxID=2971255 RepID=UPI002150AA44|nr:J domain-containing protein [Variovorax sp. ZS18.2.2]MCR6481065.1 J domain-containing protein [Variovorax sp. ZS18.2.2]
MTRHSRFVAANPAERVLVRFARDELLWCGHLGDLEVPWRDGTRHAGPTVLDLVLREGPANRGRWRLRTAQEFLEPASTSADARFLPALASGGRLVREEGEFLRVEKPSTISIGATTLRLALGLYGGELDASYEALAAEAAGAWREDLERARALYLAVREAPGGRLLETPAVAALRPSGNVSEKIEQGILRQVCEQLGVDPDLEIRRPRGRPGPKALADLEERDDLSEAGRYLRVTLHGDGRIGARLLSPVIGLAVGVDLARVPLLTLLALHARLGGAGEHDDVQLLEAFLDRSAPSWRAQAQMHAQERQAPPAVADDPYAILGVTRAMDLADITKAYRRAMQALHPDKGACPPWFAQAASLAYQRIKAVKTAEQENPSP